jgi:hypothetical protein
MVMQEAGKGFTLLERNCGMSLNQTGGEIRIKTLALHTLVRSYGNMTVYI